LYILAREMLVPLFIIMDLLCIIVNHVEPRCSVQLEAVLVADMGVNTLARLTYVGIKTWNLCQVVRITGVTYVDAQSRALP